jgi:hypothetical protein
LVLCHDLQGALAQRLLQLLCHGVYVPAGGVDMCVNCVFAQGAPRTAAERMRMPGGTAFRVLLHGFSDDCFVLLDCHALVSFGQTLQKVLTISSKCDTVCASGAVTNIEATLKHN